MIIAVYIDSCAWNYLQEKAIDLVAELPPDRYALYITREVKIEIDAIPDDEKRQALKAYIRLSIANSSIRTTCMFGFQTLEPDGTPSKVQVYGGFGHGSFQSDLDRKYYASDEVKAQLEHKAKRKSGLSANQADASLAVRSSQAFVLTNENPQKTGPLKLASENGGKVVYLRSQVEPSGLTLGQYIASLL
jgi:hypothetical protein